MPNIYDLISWGVKATTHICTSIASRDKNPSPKFAWLAVHWGIQSNYYYLPPLYTYCQQNAKAVVELNKHALNNRKASWFLTSGSGGPVDMCLSFRAVITFNCNGLFSLAILLDWKQLEGKDCVVFINIFPWQPQWLGHDRSSVNTGWID